ncbi:zinc finger protein 62 homolog isoform X1 [Arapaima gigas]
MSMLKFEETEDFLNKQSNRADPDTVPREEYTDTRYRGDTSGKFRCERCGRCYRHAGSLANHKKTHEVGSFHCPVCARVLSNALAFKNHVRIHTSSKNFSCSECGKAFRLAAQLATHQKVHTSHRSRGGSSGKVKLDTKLPQENGEVPHSTKQNFSSMDDPGIDFDSIYANNVMNGDASKLDNSDNSGEKQFDSNDSADRPFKCDQCEKTYRHHGSLINHKKSHQLGAFECLVCYKQFNNLAALTSHQRTHTKSKFRSSTMAIGASPQAAPNLSMASPQNEEAATCYCHLCEVVFPNNSSFQDHVLLHNTASSAGDLPDCFSDSDSGLFLGSQTRTCPSPTSLLKHEIGDQTPGSTVTRQKYTCAYCGEGYTDLESLKDHYLTHNSLAASNCQTEPAVLDSKRLSSGSESNAGVPSFTKEVKEQEGGLKERRFTCQICGKSYRHAGSLINHKRIHQTGQYQCSVCCKHYPHLAALHSHLRSHKTRPPCLPVSTEGDWLSSEPLTLEVQQNSFNTQDHENDDASKHSVLDDLGGSSRCVSGTSQADGLDELKEQFNSQYKSEYAPVERHMCADCGETYRDIAGIKSHLCPQRCQNHESLTNGLLVNLDFQELGDMFLQEEECGLKGPRRHQEEQAHMNFRNSHSEGNQDGKNDDTEEEDGEVYQCSVCGNHYTSLQALRTHLRSNAHSQGTPNTDLSSLSSTDEETWRRSQEVDGSLMICSTCGESFSRESDLQAHQLLHGQDVAPAAAHGRTDDVYSTVGKMEGKSTICGNCGMFCADYNQLVGHQCVSKGKKGQKVNGKEQETNEEKVEKAASRDGHGGSRQSADSEDRPHRCDQCGRSYRHPSSLLNHKKSHKTGVFRCFVCQKRFYNLLALKSHHRSHFDLKRHKCEQCGKAFKIQKQLMNHVKIHEKSRARGQELNRQLQIFAQKDGSENSQSINMLAKCRMGRSQSSAPYNKCGKSHSRNKPSSNRDAQEKLQLESDLNSKKRLFACDQCSRSYCHARSLASHKKSHNLPGPNTSSSKSHVNGMNNDKSAAEHAPPQMDHRPFVCDICSRTYRHAGSLLNHKNTHKTGNFSCSFCSKPFYNAMALRNHTRIHTQKKKHICNICGKAFRLASILHNHQKVHMQRSVDFSCPTCGKSYLGKSGLKRHRCGKVQEQISKGAKSEASVSAGEGRENRFTCEQCGRSYRHASSLLNHKNTHTTGIYHCMLCLKTFSNLLALKNHRRIHSETRRHSCPDCNKTFRVSSQLRSHRRVHTKERELVCIPCQRSFPSRISFRRHQELHSQTQQLPLHDVLGASDLDWGSGPDLTLSAPGHSSDGDHRLAADSSCIASRLSELQEPQEGFLEAVQKMHVCEHCGRTYRHASSLLNHKNSHKMGSFVCSTCQKEFSNLMALKNHRRIHTEPKRYVCSDCGKAFRVSTQLICHRRVHTKEKPFSCPYCAKTFSSKSNLRHHQKVHQNTLEASLDMGTSTFLGLGIDSYL